MSFESRLIFDGVADVYERSRPGYAPEAVTWISQRLPLGRVLDLGAGTGKLTRQLVPYALEVVAVEPGDEMRRVLQEVVPGVEALYGTAEEIPLPDESVDVVTVAQAFHWMEPQPVLREVVRLLRPGGVFAAYDYDWPPVIEPEVDEAFAAHHEARGEARRRLALVERAGTDRKQRHLDEIRASGLFRSPRELVCHGWEEVDFGRVIGLAESIGGPREIFGDEAPAVAETFGRLRETARRVLGDRTVPMLVGYRIRCGVRA
jgi:SAM-dependent methyltransferase